MIEQPAPAARIPRIRSPDSGGEPSMRDGRPANLSWLQESPDHADHGGLGQLGRAASLDREGAADPRGRCADHQSAHGFIRAKAYLMPGIHPGSVAVPIGQGHTAYGRYATNVGANPLKILDPVFDTRRANSALYATRVAITQDRSERAARQGRRTDHLQQGVKLVATLAADQVDLAKETPFVIR
jgi:hypothetical protein